MKKFLSNRNIHIWFFCFIIAFIVLLLTSTCSFLYPMNDWDDVNAFFTVGKSMMHGLIPYKDLFEQKGPFLYLIYGIAYIISHKTFIGVFILEVIFFTISLYYLSKIIKLFLSESYIFLISPIFALIVCIIPAFSTGGSAEEFCLPFMLFTLYHFLAHFKAKTISYKALFFTGLCAGIILVTKYTLLGFWFAFMASIFFDLLFHRHYQKAFLACIYFLIGMFIPFAVSSLYFILNEGFADFIRVYFIINMTAYSTSSTSIIIRLAVLFGGFISSSWQNGILSIAFILGFIFFLIPLKMPLSGKIALVVTYLFTILGVFWGLKFYVYYVYPLVAFIPISLISLFSLLSTKINLSSRFIIFLSILICFNGAYYGANRPDLQFKKRSTLYQYQFAEIINRSAHPTLVNMGALDCGLYTVTGLVPTTYFFEKQNIAYNNFPDNLDSFANYIANQQTEFIVYLSKKDEQSFKNSEIELFLKYNLVSSHKNAKGKKTAYLLQRRVPNE